jgi:receptor-type tyrosine-protein phosphatase N
MLACVVVQMVWEQGSVVIVMLTKCTADDQTPLCVRYWPEEGSDLYHIYEVNNVLRVLL